MNKDPQLPEKPLKEQRNMLDRTENVRKVFLEVCLCSLFSSL
jgi:hypothetical protein